MYWVYGSFRETTFQKIKTQGSALLKAAADKNYAPAMFFGKLQLAGTLVPKDAGAGLALIRDAAVLGSANAQEFLASKYQSGSGVEQDVEKAKRYFRLVLPLGTPECQLSLAKLLLNP